jgi:hypothetical protein
MSNRRFNKSDVYYLDGNGTSTRIACVIDGVPTQIVTSSPLKEAAAHYGFPTYTWPDDRGFAINFTHVIGVGDVKLEQTKEGVKVHMSVHNEKGTPVLGSYSCSTLQDMGVCDGGSCITFKDNYILLLPVTQAIIAALRIASVDNRNDPGVNKPPPPQAKP